MKNKTVLITLVETAIMVALAVVLSFVRVWTMPQGGTISLTMLPLFLLAFRRGPWAGIVGGAVYGLVSLIFDGVIYHPMSIFLDYVFAYGLLGVAGFFKLSGWGITAGVTVGTALRYVSSVLSGALLFAEYAGDQNPWVYSLGYNATYMLPELVICVVALVLLFKQAKRVFEVK